jgi:hypothetical protein
VGRPNHRLRNNHNKLLQVSLLTQHRIHIYPQDTKIKRLISKFTSLLPPESVMLSLSSIQLQESACPVRLHQYPQPGCNKGSVEDGRGWHRSLYTERPTCLLPLRNGRLCTLISSHPGTHLTLGIDYRPTSTTTLVLTYTTSTNNFV